MSDVLQLRGQKKPKEKSLGLKFNFWDFLTNLNHNIIRKRVAYAWKHVTFVKFSL